MGELRARGAEREERKREFALGHFTRLTVITH
jgi:hypothetical protein